MMRTLISLVMAGSLAIGASAARAQTDFNINTGNAAIEVVIPAIVPDVLFTQVSPTGGDATLVLRITTIVTNAWYDATAPWHPTAKGVYTHLPRQFPPANIAAMNTAILYASRRVLDSLLPAQADVWAGMLSGVGLDPDFTDTDPSTPAGIGNAAGEGVVIGRQDDGMNQIGDEGGRSFNPTPYADYTGYVPRNTAYFLRNPSKWQPDIQRQGMGLYKVQQFVTPQYGLVEPYAYDDPQAFSVPAPTSSNFFRRRAYKEQADEVLAASAALTEEQKLKAELFDNKIAALGFSIVFLTQSRAMSLLDFVQADFLTNMAAFDAGIFVWQEKRKYDTVRPFSAIRKLYGDELVMAYSGDPTIGATTLPASEWKSYLEEADHPEYPSASSCFCAAHARSARLFVDTDGVLNDEDDELGFPTVFPPGSSRVEPGVTPAAETTILYQTWSDFARECGQSRVWAGVHFQAAVDASLALCPVFGEMAYAYLEGLIAGDAAQPRPPSRGRPLDP